MNSFSSSSARLAVAALILALSACGSESSRGTEAATKLVLTGSSTVAPLAAEIAKRFETEHPGVRIDVQTGGSSRGIADARSGVANIGLASRALKPDEGDLIAHTLAVDGIALIAHSSNPLNGLSTDQVRALFRGELTNWSALDGPDRAVTIVNKAEGRSTLELFLHHFGLTAPEIRASAVIGDNEQGIKTVAANPGAIGYVSIGSAEYAATHGVAIRLLALDGVDADVDAVKAGRYPLSRPLNLVTLGPPQGLAHAFITYAQSPTVRDLVEELHFVALDE